jgi:uncharacterized membrane protein
VNEQRLRIAIAALSALGAAIAAYLTYTKLTDSTIACATGGCETVAQSSYSEIAGIPVASFGLLAYVALFLSTFFTAEVVRVGAAALALGGAIYALYLVYVQAAVLDAFCQWCLVSDAILLVLVLLTCARAGIVGPLRREASAAPPA